MKPKATHLVMLMDSRSSAELFWGIGYEGILFNAYQNEGSKNWIYHDHGGLHIMEPKQIRVIGPAHDVTFDWSLHKLTCKTCDQLLRFHDMTTRSAQEAIHRFMEKHGAPNDWHFEDWVMRDERRYHMEDLARMASQVA